MTDRDGELRPCYSFGSYTLDCEARVLYSDGVAVQTTPKMILLLQSLLQKPGHIIGKYDLLELLWSNQEVSEWSLSRLVSDTRQALGNEARDKDLIQTVRGQGFRLNPDIEVRLVESPNMLRETAAGARGYKSVAAIVVLAVVAAGYLLVNRYVDDGMLNLGEERRLVVLPVLVSTDDDQDGWAEYGVMTMLAGQLGRFSELKVADVESTIQALNQIEFDRSASNTDDLFQTICKPLGCSQLIAPELGLSESGMPQLTYTLIHENGRSSAYSFENEDVLQASNALFEHLLPRLLPPEPERVNVESMYTDDPVANQNFALGASSVLRGESQNAMRYLEMALERDPDYFWARAYLADALTHVEQFERATEIIDALTISATNEVHLLHLAKLRSNISYSRGNLEQSLAESAEMLRSAIILNDKEAEGVALMHMGTTSQSLGENYEAIDYLTQALAIFSDQGFELHESKTRFNLGNAYYVLDNHEQAEKYYLSSADMFRRQGATEWFSYVRYALAALRMTQGRLDLAEAEFRELEYLYETTNEVEGLLLVRGELGTIELRRGNPQLAEPLLLGAYDGAGDTYRYVRSQMSGLLAICYLNLGDSEKARPFVDERQRFDWFEPRVPMVFIPASLAHAEGDFAMAVSLALQLQDRIGEQWSERHAEWLRAFRTAAQYDRPVVTDYYHLSPDWGP